MARNEEKSHSMLNRWVTMKQTEARGAKGGLATVKDRKRPYLASMVNTLTEAEYWRTNLLKEISKNVMEIQNGSPLASSASFLLPFCPRAVSFCLITLIPLCINILLHIILILFRKSGPLVRDFAEIERHDHFSRSSRIVRLRPSSAPSSLPWAPGIPFRIKCLP